MNTGAKATDPCELERLILDPCEPKTEVEWWARARILELEDQLAQIRISTLEILDLTNTKNTRKGGEER